MALELNMRVRTVAVVNYAVIDFEGVTASQSSFLTW
jgi:hypothetical protein